MLVVHEKQVRQFCAIHTVNNLLQLPSCFPCNAVAGSRDYGARNTQTETNDAAVADRMIHRWTCNGQVLHEFQPSSCSSRECWRAATQAEFDEITQEITMQEKHLLNGDTLTENNDTTTSHERLSIWNRIWSHHGTPYLGNYSFEVLQMALQRRDVSLDYFRATQTDSEEQDDSATITNAPLQIGYVIYEASNSCTSYMKQMGSYMPVVKHFCHGKHWYAITRVKYQCLQPGAARSSSQKEATWRLIDSKFNNTETIESDEQLMQRLKKVQSDGGLVFCASFSKPAR